LAFAHHLAASGDSVAVTYIRSDEIDVGQNLDVGARHIKTILQNCKHGITFETRKFRSIQTRARFVPESRWFNMTFFKKNMLDLRSELDISNFSQLFESKRVFYGFFQDYEFLSKAIYKVIEDVETYFKSVPNQTRTTTRNIVHVRGGDYLKPNHLQEFGVLSQEYYTKVYEITGLDFSKEFAFVTNDVDLTMKLFPKIGKNSILDPRQVDELQCLFLMADSELLCIANSSLSCWGAFLAINRGGHVIAPYPWLRRELKSYSFSKVYSSKMQLVPAKYID
jgi:hypothetical protein